MDVNNCLPLPLSAVVVVVAYVFTKLSLFVLRGPDRISQVDEMNVCYFEDGVMTKSRPE